MALTGLAVKAVALTGLAVKAVALSGLEVKAVALTGLEVKAVALSGLEVKAVAHLGSIPPNPVGIFPGRVIPVTSKLIKKWFSCRAPGDLGSALGLVGPASVYHDWAREQGHSGIHSMSRLRFLSPLTFTDW